MEISIQEEKKETLFDRIGGKETVDKAVDIFYRKVMADPHISSMFEDIDMERQRAKQKVFLTHAFGAFPNYSGPSMSKSHEKLVKEKGLNDSHFDAIISHLDSTMADIGVSIDLQDEVRATVGQYRDAVLGRL